jgi:DNA-binding transcriptional regulator YiaG
MKEWIPDEVRQFRAQLRLTQTAFGNLLGVSRIHVYYLEKGVKRPSKTLMLLLDCIEKEKGKAGEKNRGKRHLSKR